ncbi:MAG: thiamine phosphate synthase [Nitrospirae bacterium CG_4_9_14_3_um_filter_53_35]|nr:MAG: thiamine phosphate synthase [Nitrospirae bacterium CG_4_8_14_3_um_filter_50_41]PIX87008.1 MAG: thiamine phosphate synthase [Nitrospirae bacterium CG_4_10_14_3_um_filter_53_41]PJA74808.1 MAG: thiamine phosphate synthase [Nitrospirae bacterium CG_4_9_14_3_um_filter_53_35]
MKERMPRNGTKWKLCVIVGGEADPHQTAEAVLKEGAGVIQYRGKGKPGRVQLREAAELRVLTRQYGADLVINDRLDIAMLSDADGLHLGAEDLPVPAARRFLDPGRMIGATAHSLYEARQAEKDGADYIGFGSVFATRSKKGVPVSGVEALEEAVRKVGVPVIGIGGITPMNIREVFKARAAGAAVLSFVSGSSHPGGAVRALLKPIRGLSTESGDSHAGSH